MPIAKKYSRSGTGVLSLRLLSIHACKPGMRLAKKIINDEGLVLLAENAELTASILKRLERLGIDFVYIVDAMTEDVVVPELLSETTRREAMLEIRSQFRRLMEQPVQKQAFSYPQLGKQFRKVLGSVIDDLSAHEDAMIMLTEINSTDHYLFRHSLNVCMYATLLGIANGYSRDELMTLGLGALLHDIGKTQISDDILQKPGPLTESEFAEMKRHTVLGFQMLKDEPNIPLLSAHCAFQHHERINGSGYPRGLQGDAIDEYAKWIGVVDSYDAMTCHRVYRQARLPHQAMEILYTGSGTLYEQRMLETFRDKVAIYPLGIDVRLNTGEKGVVVRIHPSNPQRPVVRVLQSPDNTVLSAPYEIDLSTRLNLIITEVG